MSANNYYYYYYYYYFGVTFRESCFITYDQFLLFILQSRRDLLLWSLCLVGNALSAYNLFNKKIRFWAVGAAVADC